MEPEETVRIREIMSHPAVVVPPELSVKEAAAMLDAHGFTCMPVVTSDGRLVGVVSEAELLAGRFPPDPKVPLFDRVASAPRPTLPKPWHLAPSRRRRRAPVASPRNDREPSEPAASSASA